MKFLHPGIRAAWLPILLGTGAAAAQDCLLEAVTGVPNAIWALAVFDDGAGEALYAGGLFTSAGGLPQTAYIARWDGAAWSSVGGGASGFVLALHVFDDGSGPALYAAGDFTVIGGVSANRVARWDGTAWWPLGPGTSGRTRALAAFDDGGGPALYAGGSFSSAGGAPASRIARWDGQAWSALGTGVTTGFEVSTIAVFDDGGGAALYAGGQFTVVAGLPETQRIARWDGHAWSPVGSTGANSIIWKLYAFDGGGGPALYAGGDFTNIGGVSASHIARWDGASWSPLGAGVDSTVYGFGIFDDGRGEALYAGGWFTSAGGAPAGGVARWDGQGWSPLGGGTDGRIIAFARFDDTTEATLYAGGEFWSLAGGPGEYFARWRCTVVAPCYANCDGSTTEPILNVDDFTCFINEFAAAQGLPYQQQVQHYANCDGSTTAPVLNVDDFTCFIDAFAQGCP